MTEDRADDVYRALVKIGDFLRKAKPEHIKSFLADDARLEIVPSGWKVSPPPAPKPPRVVSQKVAQPSAPFVEQQLRALTSTDQATEILAGMGLNLTQTRKLAADLGLRGANKLGVHEIVALIVRTFVGSRLDSEALQRF